MPVSGGSPFGAGPFGGLPPLADFSALPVNGATPLDVQFTDLSTENPTSWAWDFGDGNTDTVQNPLHTYLVAGTYDVTLTVFNVNGNGYTTKSAYITVTSSGVVTNPWMVIARRHATR